MPNGPAASSWGQPAQQKDPEKSRRQFKPEKGVIRPPNGHARPKAKPAEPRNGRVNQGHEEKVALAHEELRQLNLKKLQFLLKQEHRNADAVRRLVELVHSLCHFFRMLPKSLQVEVCAVMKLETYVRNEVIFTMGDAPDKFYIIASGKVEVCVNEVAGFRSGQFHSVAVLKAGDSFGEMALLLDAPRSATVVVQSTRAEVLTVTREEFQRVLRDLYGVSLQERLLFLRSLQMFEVVPTHQLEAMAHLLQAVVHTEGTVFDVMNDNTVYFVVEGDCRLRRAVAKNSEAIPTVKGTDPFYDAHTISRLGPGNFFGEAALFAEFRHEGWYVEAKTDCKFYIISGPELLQQCSREIVQVMRSSCLFKFDYFKSRFGVLQQMDVKRKEPTFGMAVARNLKPTQGKSEGGGAKDRPRTGVSTSHRMRLRNREESDSGAQAVTVLEQLKQHILESALELERQRLEVYNSSATARQPAAKPAMGSTAASQTGTALSANVSRSPSKQVPRQRLPPVDALTSRTEKEVRQQKRNAYPRSAKSTPTNGPVEALMAANGLRVYGEVEGEGEELVSSGSELFRAAKSASPGPAECSGYMQVGGPGYIGYETKHTRASVASREQQIASGNDVKA